jgi:hypothetical protein
VLFLTGKFTVKMHSIMSAKTMEGFTMQTEYEKITEAEILAENGENFNADIFKAISALKWLRGYY